MRIRILLLFWIALRVSALAQTHQLNPELEKFFRQEIGLNNDQIAAMRNGRPVAKALQPRLPGETLLFGAIYIHASPESYFQRARNFDRLRKLPNYLALGVFTEPPQLTDLQGFGLESDDIQALKDCKPGNCRVQLPETSIDELHRTIQWSAADVDEQVNRLLRARAYERLLAYQREGNQSLGAYNDRPDPTQVPEQFAWLLSYHKELAQREPDFYHYLLNYPRGKPAHYEETFYWENVRFGLKPTLRIVHMVSMRGAAGDPVANAIARKQLYSSHYFQTALDLSICVREDKDPRHIGFYLVDALGSEGAPLTGPKGTFVRKVGIGRAVGHLQQALMNVKAALETGEDSAISDNQNPSP